MAKYFKHLPPLETLISFDAAHRHQSFTRAANELNLSQASISRRVRELEQNLGVTLFERRRYDVAATVEGEKLSATVRVALSELNTVGESLRTGAARQGSLTVFSDLSIATGVISPLIGEFQRLHPTMRLRLLASYEPIESVREHFDIGFQHGRWAEDRFEIEPVADDAIFPVCAPGIAAQLPHNPAPVDIAKQPLLHLADVGRRWPDWRSFLAQFRIREPEPIEGLVFDSYQVCLDVAAQGGGIALGWARSVRSRLDVGELVRIPGMTMPLIDSINVHRPKGAKFNSIAPQFLNLLRKRIPPVA